MACCLLAWVLMRAVFFVGVAGSDDLYYIRFAALWDRVPANDWEARLLGNALTAMSMAAFGNGEIAAVLPSLAASLASLAGVLYWCRTFGTHRQALWAGMLAALLPLGVDAATVVSPHTIMTAFLTAGTVAVMLAPDSRRACFAAAALLSLGVVTHLAGVYYVIALSAAVLIVDPRRYRFVVVAALLAISTTLALDMAAFHLFFGDAFGRFRVCMAEMETNGARIPWKTDGVFSPEFVLWPLRSLFYSKAFGISLSVAIAWGIWTFRRLDSHRRILLITAVLLWAWMGFGSQIPWAYRPFGRMSRFLEPLTLSVAVLFATLMTTGAGRHAERSVAAAASRPRESAPPRRSDRSGRFRAWAGVAILAICVLNLSASGSWSQNVSVSRELSAYVRAHREKRFVTDYHTLNEMYIADGLKTWPNVVTTDDVGPSQLLDGEAVRISKSEFRGIDEILVNPLNLRRSPGFAALIDEHGGVLRYRTSPSYRLICILWPPLRRSTWALRKPSALVVDCLDANTTTAATSGVSGPDAWTRSP